MTLGAIAAYVLAVGWQPSVIRAGVAGALASLAWLAARPRDRWHFLALGALVLLAWTPTSLLEPGFQLSFAAVAGIFVGVPRLNARLDGYPVPRGARDVLGVALVCGLVTAPIVLFHFGEAPVYTVPANALAFPAMPAVLGLGLLAAAADPFSPAAASALAWLAGWAAAWLELVARLVASLPGAQVDARAALVVMLVCAAAWVTARHGRLARRRPRPCTCPRRGGRRARGRRGRVVAARTPGLAGTRRAPGDVPGRGARRLGSPRDAERPAPRRSGATRSERRRPAPTDGNPFAVGARAHASPARPHRWGRRRHSPAGSRGRARSRAGCHRSGLRGGDGRVARAAGAGADDSVGLGVQSRRARPPCALASRSRTPFGGSEPQRHRPRGHVRRARRVPPSGRGIRRDLAPPPGSVRGRQGRASRLGRPRSRRPAPRPETERRRDLGRDGTTTTAIRARRRSPRSPLSPASASTGRTRTAASSSSRTAVESVCGLRARLPAWPTLPASRCISSRAAIGRRSRRRSPASEPTSHRRRPTP